MLDQEISHQAPQRVELAPFHTEFFTSWISKCMHELVVLSPCAFQFMSQEGKLKSDLGIDWRARFTLNAGA